MSPVCIGDRVFFISDDGTVTVVAATDKFEVLGKGTLGEATQSSPAISGGRMFFRTEKHLMALGAK